MSLLNITTLTSQKLRNGEYKDTFPEYYNLQRVVENGVWHDHQDVFAHVVYVYETLEKELEHVPPIVGEYLSQKIGNHTRAEILKVGTLLHDIAKKETLVVSPTGQANCPGHEHIAAGQVQHFAKRFDLDDTAESYVQRIVLHHGFISDILFQAVHKPDKEEVFWSLFVDTVGDVYYELLLLMVSDLNGCDLQTGDPDQYQSLEKLLRKWLETKANGL